MPQVLTATEVIEQKLDGYRFFVELATLELEIDDWGIPVSKDSRVIDLVVAQPSSEAIEQLIALVPFLEGYSVVDYWQAGGSNCPF